MQIDSANELTPDKLESHAQELERKFPDADPDHIRQALASEKNDHLKQVSEKFNHGAYKKRPASQMMPTPTPAISAQQSGLFSSLRRKLLSNDNSPQPQSLKSPPAEISSSSNPPSMDAPRPKSLLPPPSQVCLHFRCSLEFSPDLYDLFPLRLHRCQTFAQIY